MKKLKHLLFLGLVINSSFLFSQKPEWQYFSMNGNECQTFITKGNSRIMVPPYCFLSDGKPYIGPLTIAFKEYKDQVDFILGGLSLRYEINGSLKTLQSGGMFEIDIKLKDKSAKVLEIASTKKVTVKFAIDPKFDVAGLEPFYFDPATKKWVKTTRFGSAKEGNDNVPDNTNDLWQDDPKSVKFQDIEQRNDNDQDGGCYFVSMRRNSDPNSVYDSMICPPDYNPLDSKYADYLSNQAFKTMQIDKMGLYNYDKIFNEEDNVLMFVNLTGKGGKPLDLKGKMYVVYKLSNSVIYYYKDDLATKFSLLPRTDISIFIFNEDGTVSRVPDYFWKNFDAKRMKNKTINLPFEDIKLVTLTKDEFASITGLKH